MSGEHRLGRESATEAHPVPSLVPAEPAASDQARIDAHCTPELTLHELLNRPNVALVEFYPDGTLRSIAFAPPPKPEKPGKIVPIRPEPKIAGTAV